MESYCVYSLLLNKGLGKVLPLYIDSAPSFISCYRVPQFSHPCPESSFVNLPFPMTSHFLTPWSMWDIENYVNFYQCNRQKLLSLFICFPLRKFFLNIGLVCFPFICDLPIHHLCPFSTGLSISLLICRNISCFLDISVLQYFLPIVSIYGMFYQERLKTLKLSSS